MRILFVNKYLYAKGGSETHLLGLASVLSERGHAVDFFGTEHPRNATPPFQTVTVPHTEYTESDGWLTRLKKLREMIYSMGIGRRMEEYLNTVRPDVAHLHNIYHQLSPAPLVALREAGVPTIMTAHDYKLVCPSYSLHDGTAQCFACRGHRYWNVLVRNCSRKGRSGDLALAIEAYAHHLWRIYERNLDLVIAPSRFVRDRLVDGGFPGQRVRVLPNALPVSEYQVRSDPGNYMLFVGRLSYEKGLPVLIEAARIVQDIPIWIVGDGPLRQQLEERARGLSNVRFLGRQPAAELKAILCDCRAVVLPSVVPENCPLSLLEAFAAGKPAIATRVGGIPELFEGSPVGITVAPQDPESLASAMRQFWEDPDLGWHCGVEARRRVESQHDITTYVAELEQIYRSLADRAQGSLAQSEAAGEATCELACTGVAATASEQRRA